MDYSELSSCEIYGHKYELSNSHLSDAPEFALCYYCSDCGDYYYEEL